jgi:5'-nucleotidase/UDP-sugar diphosphatase
MAFQLSRRAAKTCALLLSGVAAIGVVSAASASSMGCSNPTGGAQVCPPGQTCQTRLTILHTGDVHSRLFPYTLEIAQVDSELGLGTVGDVVEVGGIARVSYILGRERARSDRVLHLNAGDWFEGAPIFNVFSGQPEMQAASYVGTDAMVIGNHEFDDGAQNAARQIQQWADFPVLAANYQFDDPLSSSSSTLGTVLHPFTLFNVDGLKVACIGMGNISSLGSVFNQPNSFSITPLNTIETAQFYVDLLRPLVDVVVILSHLGLDDDEAMVAGTTGIDAVMGGHNHIVVNPPQVLKDCSADPNNPGYVWAVDPNLQVNPNVAPPDNAMYPDPVNHPYQFQRPCQPRNVLIAQSGAFTKYVGRLDLILSNDPTQASPTGNPKDYDPVNGFEVISSVYQAFPITASIPDDPSLDNLLEPYYQQLLNVVDLDNLIGFSPLGAKRIAATLGDSPLGNLVATSMWLTLGVQTDFALTNSTGIRVDMNPGPVDVTEIYNIFPFNNTITKMELSGVEVRELFDFVSRRGAGRGCDSQAQIAGARVRLNCTGCNPKYRPDTVSACQSDQDCTSGAVGACDLQTNMCLPTPCAEEIYIGYSAQTCMSDTDCAPGQDPNQALPGQCDLSSNPNSTTGQCLLPIVLTNLYQLATNNYIAAGGSGYLVLQRNTTQLNTQIEQRDALADWIQQGKPCGYVQPTATSPGGIPACSTDSDCASGFVCACPGHVVSQAQGGVENCVSGTLLSSGAVGPSPCGDGVGACVRQDCRSEVAQYHESLCSGSPALQQCLTTLDACSLGGEECKYLSCVDATEGAVTDNRIFIVQ